MVMGASTYLAIKIRWTAYKSQEPVWLQIATTFQILFFTSDSRK